MMDILDGIDMFGKIVAKISDNKDFQKLICGHYEDGSIRNIVDAVRGETESPKSKKKKKKKIKKGKKKKYKLDKKGYKFKL